MGHVFPFNITLESPIEDLQNELCSRFFVYLCSKVLGMPVAEYPKQFLLAMYYLSVLSRELQRF